MDIITSAKKWNDILPQSVAKELLKAISKKITAGKSATAKTKATSHGMVLLYGAAIDNRTAAAALIGTHLNQEVYRVDSSTVASKYIGETEKNLDTVFSKADNKNSILFFDEADALFGKRTDVKDSHDKYANTVANYLLQRIEAHSGLVVVSASSKSLLPSSLSKHFIAEARFLKKDKKIDNNIALTGYLVNTHPDYRKDTLH